MTAHMQNPAGQGGACEGTHLEKRVITQDNIGTESKAQDNILGSISKNGRERIQISLRTFNEHRLCDLRVYKNIHGVDTRTSNGVTIRAANIRNAIDLLELAEIAARTEGLIQ